MPGFMTSLPAREVSLYRVRARRRCNPPLVGRSWDARGRGRLGSALGRGVLLDAALEAEDGDNGGYRHHDAHPVEHVLGRGGEVGPDELRDRGGATAAALQL